MNRYLMLFALAVLSFAGSGFAAEEKAFDASAFAALQNAGKPILIDVRADWCPTCKRQAPILSSLLASPEFKDYTLPVVSQHFLGNSV